MGYTRNKKNLYALTCYLVDQLQGGKPGKPSNRPSRVFAASRTFSPSSAPRRTVTIVTSFGCIPPRARCLSTFRFGILLTFFPLSFQLNLTHRSTAQKLRPRYTKPGSGSINRRKFFLRKSCGELFLVCCSLSRHASRIARCIPPCQYSFAPFYIFLFFLLTAESSML